MTARIKRLLAKPLHRYVIIGGSVYVLELLTIFIAQYFGASALFAVGISFWVGLVVSFALQKLVTFQDSRMHHQILIPQIVAFSLLVIFNFGFTLLVTNLLSPTVPTVLTRTIAIGVTTIWNFYLYKTRIFKMSGEVVVQ